MSSLTVAGHEQVDLLNEVQEHLVLFVLDALSPPANGAGDLQGCVGRHLLLLVLQARGQVSSPLRPSPPLPPPRAQV